MGYGKEIFQKAMTQLDKRKSAAEQAAETQLQDFYLLCPKAEEIARTKTAEAARIAKAVLAGGNVKSALEKLRDRNLFLQGEFLALLTQHGLQEKDIQPQYHCPDCRDTGFIDGKMCQCLKQLQKQIAFASLSMEVSLEKYRFDNFDLSFYEAAAAAQMERIFSYCKKYALAFRATSPSLLFRGATGLGKTHLSLAITHAAIEKGFGVVYGSSQNFAVSLERERFDRIDPAQAAGTEKRLLACDLLILDDLGTEFSSAYVTAALYNIVNTRLLEGKPTIISTNLTTKELEARYSERFASRIMGNFGTFNFVGNDVRIQKRQQKK